MTTYICNQHKWSLQHVQYESYNKLNFMLNSPTLFISIYVTTISYQAQITQSLVNIEIYNKNALNFSIKTVKWNFLFILKCKNLNQKFKNFNIKSILVSTFRILINLRKVVTLFLPSCKNQKRNYYLIIIYIFISSSKIPVTYLKFSSKKIFLKNSSVFIFIL